MTEGEQIERLARLEEQRKIWEIANEQGAEAVIQYLKQALGKPRSGK